MSDIVNDELETTDSEISTTDKLVFVAVGAAATVLGVSIYRAVRKIRKMEKHEEEVDAVITDLDSKKTPAS